MDRLLQEGMCYTQELGMTWPEDLAVTEEKVGAPQWLTVVRLCRYLSQWFILWDLGRLLALLLGTVSDSLVHHEPAPVLLLQGCFPGADASKVSSRAKARGAAQCGTLGSGNHYVEVQVATMHSLRLYSSATTCDMSALETPKGALQERCSQVQTNSTASHCQDHHIKCRDLPSSACWLCVIFCLLGG